MHTGHTPRHPPPEWSSQPAAWAASPTVTGQTEKTAPPRETQNHSDGVRRVMSEGGRRRARCSWRKERPEEGDVNTEQSWMSPHKKSKHRKRFVLVNSGTVGLTFPLEHWCCYYWILCVRVFLCVIISLLFFRAYHLTLRSLSHSKATEERTVSSLHPRP